MAALVARAVAGDSLALERLLLVYYDRLERHIAARLPPRLQPSEAVEDILQQTFCQAFRDIRRFQVRGGAETGSEDERAAASFGNWLVRIAENRLLDAIKKYDRAKRGGGQVQVSAGAGDESRILPLLEWIPADHPSPSSIVARDEAIHALHIALASLPADQRDAIRWRVLDGKSLEETAAAMGRSPGAVRGLIHRGKQQLQSAMGRASQWLKPK